MQAMLLYLVYEQGMLFFCSLHPSQQFFSYVGTGFPGLKQYLAWINVSCSRTQHRDKGEARTNCPSVSSQAFFHRVSALHKAGHVTNLSTKPLR